MNRSKLFFQVVACLSFSFLFFQQLNAHQFQLKEKSLASAQHPQNDIRFIENKNQWENAVAFKMEMNYGALFLEKYSLTYSFVDENQLEKLKHAKQGNSGSKTPNDWNINAHAFKVNFVDAMRSVQVSGAGEYTDYRNYFVGNDKNKWATGVKSFHEVLYSGIYPGIDLKFYGAKGSLKYDFIVQSNANTDYIALEYEGLNQQYVKNGNLYLVTSVNTVVEQKPYAYQIINGRQTAVACNYRLQNNRLTFEFPDGYNKNLPLVIDPVLSFSTYTGSTADNFGFTATYDMDGNLYAGGIVFNIGYPTTLGAFQVNYSGQVDVGITKFTPDGANLVYSTYLGGTDTEAPNSLIVNNANELIILGVTGSSNFPTSANAYDNTFNGGTFVNYPGNGTTFNNGTDIFLTKLNASGTALIGSTYIGGTGNDGINQTTAAQLNHNYSDQFRGEVIIDAQDNIYVASSTRSVDFPVTAGAFQSTLSGTQDAVVFKLNSNLSSLNWSSYLGGSGIDAGFSVKEDGNGNLFVCGGTISTDFPQTAGGLNPTFMGGSADGYIAKINNNGTSLLQSTYIGTSAYDQTFFVETDRFDNIYVFGQTRGVYPVTTGVYSNPNTKQFIHKLNNDLNTTLFSTTFGSGTTNINISPTAFLVDVCGNIFASGWGGNVNTSWNSQTGTTFGMPTTSGAFQTTTDGSDFYFIVLGTDAATLEYATFFGGNGSAEHVDGGTSRFDRRGAIYQAVCAGCGGNSLFPTTSGVWSNTNNSFNCNLGAIKYDFQISAVTVDVVASPSVSGCAPLTVNFSDNGVNAQTHFWDFDDGNTSSSANPTHTFDNPGTYDVMLVGFDAFSCNGVVLTDTSYVTIQVFAAINVVIDTGICSGQSYFAGGALQTTGGVYFDTYLSSGGCDSIVETRLTVHPVFTTIIHDTICDGDSYFAGGAYQTTTGIYYDNLLSQFNCDSIVETHLVVQPLFFTSESITLCVGDTYNGVQYFNNATLTENLTSSNGCDSTHTVNIEVQVCCPPPVLLCDTVHVPNNQLFCGTFILPEPNVITQCGIASLTSDYAGGPFPEGTTIITWIAEDIYGNRDTCEQAVVYNSVNLFSSYTILGEHQVDLYPTNDVRTGAVGVMAAGGEAYLQNHTMVTGVGSFVAAPRITTFPNTQVSNAIYTTANVTLPPFETNTNLNGQDITITTNNSMVLTDTVYGRIRLFRGATVTFSNPYGVVNVREIRVNNKAAGSHTTLKFNQCTKVRVKERVDLGPLCTINPDSMKVIFYVEGANATSKDNQPAADIGPRAKVYADFYVPNGRFYAHPGTNVKPAEYTGTYIAKWVTGDPDIVWNRRAGCDSSYNCPSPLLRLAGINDEIIDGITFETNPNPMRDVTTIKFSLNHTADKVSLHVYNTTGQVVSNLYNGNAEANKAIEIQFNAADLPSGIYYTTLQTGNGYYSRKIAVMK
jgi:hypothetical protein